MAGPLAADPLRVATWDPELSRDGPGLLYRDITARDDPQVAAAVQVITAAHPDILLLTGFDWDYEGRALRAFTTRLAAAGIDYPYFYAPRPNTGMDTGLDLDGNGRAGEPRDAQGYGRFTGEGGMALLSRLRILTDDARDFSDLLWADLPGTLIESARLSREATAIQRLSTTAHWDVPVQLSDGRTLHLMAFSATPPVFDGPEDRNGRRNHDEIVFWQNYLGGVLPQKPADTPFLIMGNANLDPDAGEGRREAIRALLADPRLQDPRPSGAGAGPGDDALDTAEFGPAGPENLRLDYVLPSATLKVTGAGTLWPAPADPLADTVHKASRHRLVWVDIALP